MEEQNMNGTVPETQEKTFTQEQVNAIVGKRLAEAKASSEAALSKKEAELNIREMQIRAKELLAEKGLPKDLADVLRYSDEDSLKAAIDVIERSRDSIKAPDMGKGIFEGFKPIVLNEHDGPDPLREAMKLK